MLLSDFIGYIGVALVLGAFFMSQAGKVNLESYTYSLMNLIGATLVLYSLYFNLNWPSVIIQLAWTIISIYGIAKVYIRRKTHT